MNIDAVVAVIFAILGISRLYYYARLKRAEKLQEAGRTIKAEGCPKLGYWRVVK